MKEVTAKQFFNTMYLFMCVMCCLSLFTLVMSILGMIKHLGVGLFGIEVPPPYEVVVPIFNGILVLVSYKLAQKYRRQMEALKWR